MEACKILIVEDESLVAMDMVDMLTKMGYDILHNAMGYNDAVAVPDSHKPDLSI